MDKWNELKGFALEFLLQDANNSEFTAWVYIIANGKKNGLTIEEIAKDFIDFWGTDYDWLEKPETLMLMEQFSQSRCLSGYFEEVENTPEKVSYRFKKIWAEFIRNRGENGEWLGVTENDVVVPIKLWLEMVTKEKGWTLEWKDEGMNALVTIKLE
jgi:hypothetical protein